MLTTFVSVGLSLPAQHVDESWQSAEFFANKVASCSEGSHACLHDAVMHQVSDDAQLTCAEE